jgi:hypothetical protein
MGVSFKRQPIVAVDFDGTLVKGKFPGIGALNQYAVDKLTGLHNKSDLRIIVWTCRVGLSEKMAKNYLEKIAFPFETINKNVVDMTRYLGLTALTRKVYADYYIDDHNWLTDPWSHSFWDAFEEEVVVHWPLRQKEEKYFAWL